MQPSELTLLGRREQAAVADLAHVELERIRGLQPVVFGDERVVRFDLLHVDLVERGQKAEGGLGGLAFDGRFGQRVLHPVPIGGRSLQLEM